MSGLSPAAFVAGAVTDATIKAVVRYLGSIAQASRSALTQVFGTDIPDLAVSPVVVAGGTLRRMPTVSQNSILTLNGTAASKGQRLTIVKTATSAFTVTINNGGPLGATAKTSIILPVSVPGNATFYFDGSDWQLVGFGTTGA